MQKPWSMYNKEEKLRIDDLKAEHVKIILLAIPTARMRDWYACQEGDLHWQPIAAIPEFYEDVRQIKGNNPEMPAESPTAPTPARRPLFEDAPDGSMLTDPALTVDSARTKERRSARRYPRQVTFKVIEGGKSFASQTVDISMAGLSIEEDLPDWVTKTFRAELASSRGNVRVLCRRVGARKMKLVDADSWDVLRQWLVNW